MVGCIGFKGRVAKTNGLEKSWYKNVSISAAEEVFFWQDGKTLLLSDSCGPTLNFTLEIYFYFQRRNQIIWINGISFHSFSDLLLSDCLSVFFLSGIHFKYQSHGNAWIFFTKTQIMIWISLMLGLEIFMPVTMGSFALSFIRLDG